MPLKLRLIQGGLMSLLLSLLMTCRVTFINLGFSAHFYQQWGKAFLLAWPAAFVIAVAIGPAVGRWSHWLNQRLAAG